MSLPYFPMYPTDFEADTSHLTLAEDGAYNRLLRLMWMAPGCSLPDDDQWIFRRMRCLGYDEECKIILAMIDEFFERKGGRIINSRLAKEYQKTDLAHRKRVESGSKGGKAKALKTNKVGPSNAKAMLKQPEPEPEVKEYTSVYSQKKPKRKSRISENASISDGQLRAAEKRGHSKQEAEAQFQRFKNNALAKGLTYLDWNRAFITWLDSPYFKPITAISGGKVDPEKQMATYAEHIKSGKSFLCGSIPPTAARELIAAGQVTEEQARKVGVI